MKLTKRLMAAALALVTALSATACNGNNESSKPNDDSNAATTTAANNSEDNTSTDSGTSDEQVELTFAWWGGDSRHEATQAAVDKFTELHPNIKVNVQFGAWTDWETARAQAFSVGNTADVEQVNWNWLTSFSSDGSVFLDLNSVSDTLDLTQFSESSLNMCNVGGKLQAVPVSLTGRIFYWNKSTFEKAGLETPKTFADLKAAGEIFKTKLGEDYYPLVMGEFDRIIFMVHYLESVYGKNWVENGALNYTADEIKTGFEMIKELEDLHVIPTIQTVAGDGATSLDKNPKWIEGKYAGIFEWDSSATKFESALAEGNEFIVGDYFADMGEYQGGFSKISLAFAISQNTKHPKEAAMLINFLLNEAEGAKILGTSRGIPLSKAGLAAISDQLSDDKVAVANAKVLDWVKFDLDPKFEAPSLKTTETGVYYEVFAGYSYGTISIDDAVSTLMDGINTALSE